MGRWPARPQPTAGAHPTVNRPLTGATPAATLTATRAGPSRGRDLACRPPARSRGATPERRIGLREHERGARVERADRAPVLVDDLVVDRPLERALGVLDVDPGEGVRAVEHELDLARRIAEVVHGLEDEPDVLEARQVGGHHHEDRLGDLEHAEVHVVEPLVDVDQGVVVHRRELLGDQRQVLRAGRARRSPATAARAAGRSPSRA